MKDSIQYLEHLQQPFMAVMPGYEKGKIINTYGGQIDILPTLEHLLGIKSNSFLQVGQDLLSPDHQETVAFRTANSFVTPKYTSYDGRTYYTEVVLKSVILMSKLRPNWKAFVRQSVNSWKLATRFKLAIWYVFYQKRSSWNSWYRKYFLPQFLTNSAKNWARKR